ncbi:peptide ABC transporter substrate-binding protein [Demequina oxidasica]|uniref:peptide ABC transporter substrate-binding protein n=1 Tax=Demequina oxidasica TaxID=676199 RepID=UPI0007848BE7|nr:ABC transporter substrate-binding protein [Demequina oxidasica]
MKVRKAVLAGLAATAVASLVLAGCSSSDDTDSTPTSSTATSGDAMASGGVIRTNGSEPENPLIPTATNETGGGKILDAMFAGLVYYDGTGAAHNDLAESITQVDPTSYEIKIKPDQTFTNGEPVVASSFVDAWNYGALASNAQNSSYFFEDIEGFSYDEDSELTGLTVVDDLTFDVKLNKEASDFPLRLGYSAFYPLPASAFEDMEAFGANPVGNGPYMLAGPDAWQHDVQIELVTNPDYTGERKPANDGLTIVFYATQDAAYADLLAGQVDVIDGIPDSSLQTYEADLGERAVNQPAAIFQSFTIPQSLEHFEGEEGMLRRQALSMAINRDEITDVIFNGTRTPASDFTSPVIDGWSDTLEGAEVLAYNPDEAVKLWAEADAMSPWEGTFQIAYNADGGHDAWVDAVNNSIKNTLGIEASGNPYPTFGEFRTDVTDRTIDTAFRTGWQADYPGLFNFLGPLYATNAGSNDGDYSNADFDALLQQGNTAADAATANGFYQDAQEILLKDLPAVPLWYSNVNGGYAEGVNNVQFGWNSVPLYYEITKG